MRKRKQRFVVALSPLTTDKRTIRRGDRLPEDDPLVGANPERFVPDDPGLTDVELEREWHQRVETRVNRDPKPRALREKDAVVALTSFTIVGPEGPIEITRGERLHAREWVVRHEPKRFVSLTEFERQAAEEPRRLRPHERRALERHT